MRLFKTAGWAVLSAGLLLSVRCETVDLNATPEFGFIQRIVASDAQDGNDFGFSVDICGDAAIVGAPGARSGDSPGGAAYIFCRYPWSPDRWRQVKKLVPSDAQEAAFFGGAVAVDGDYALVGACYDDGGGTNRGAVYVYYRNLGGSDNWGEWKKITAPDALDYDFFGNALDIHEDRAIIGAWEKKEGGWYRGAAYLFDRNQGGPDNWGDVRKIVPSDPQDDKRFGSSVALSGDQAVVGALGDSEAGWVAGAAYVFSRNQGGPDNWGELTKIMGSGVQSPDEFGSAAAISGETMVVGVPYMGATGLGGAACVFSRNLGGPDHWGEARRLTASDSEFADGFGLAVAVQEDDALVGAAVKNGGGAVYVFHNDSGGANYWGEVQKISAPDSETGNGFGVSLALDGQFAIIGSPWRGAAYILIRS